MCGIAGYIAKDTKPRARETICQLLEPIRERGPDDEGICLVNRKTNEKHSFRTERTVPKVASRLPDFRDAASEFDHDISLLHTRYSIIDLSEGGHQPFVSQDGSVIAVFNGEIYNYLELRAELTAGGHTFRTSSDTEVLVEGYRAWGKDIWTKMNGFWAVALYDCSTRSLLLSRDRIGVSPLYWRETSDAFYFASSIQSLVDIDPSGVSIDRDVAAGFIDTAIKDFDDTTFYEQIRSLPAASVTSFGPHSQCYSDAESSTFWCIPDQRWKASDLPFNEAVESFRDTFVNAVEIRLRADVQVSFELSGGLDSSSIVAVAAQLRNNNITTYTIKVPEQDEEPYARAILERYPVDYRVLCEPENDFLPAMEEFAQLIQEPFHSPSIYSHYWMRTKMKAEGVAAVLSGCGGDEALAGYETQFWNRASEDLRNEGHRLHASTYGLAMRFGSWERILETASRGTRRSSHKIRRATKSFLRHGSLPIRAVKRHFLNGARSSQSPDDDNQQRRLSKALHMNRRYASMSYSDQRLFHFRVGLLPYYLRSNDHFTMSIPLEHRFPLLDYRIVELGMTLPTVYLFKNGWTKYILRKAMEPWLPKKILWRKTKMGFPFALNRFLAEQQSKFEPLFEEVSAQDLDTRPLRDYSTLLSLNRSARLWRICSVGLWMQGIRSQCA